MTTRFLIGDVFDRLAEIPSESVDLVLCSPPFLALRSYLPADHPDKAREIGSEATPADFLDTLLELTAEWGRVLAPHGSIAIELGDTYSGSGGAGGDYSVDGLRAGQQAFDGSAAKARRRVGDYPVRDDYPRPARDRTRKTPEGWPLDKSLCFIPQLYGACLAYGRNLLTGEPSPAGMWRVRTVKPWIRSNPPVGALGDKDRPATSYVIVATKARDRYFDLDAVRTRSSDGGEGLYRNRGARGGGQHIPGGGGDEGGFASRSPDNAAGAPPRDWWHHVDAVLDACLDERAGRASSNSDVGGRHKAQTGSRPKPGEEYTPISGGAQTIGAQGVHLRRALERAGILRTLEAHDVSPKGYRGAHYAVWPPELVRQLVAEMCPHRVCTTCGQPSRRLIEGHTPTNGADRERDRQGRGRTARPRTEVTDLRQTVGWSDCGHGTWRRGLVLDPFVGSGTTLAVASGMGRDSIGIDLDERNADLARERVGMFLEIIDKGEPSPCT